MRIRRKTHDEIIQENKVKQLETQNEALQAKLEYVAIMIDVDIDIEPQEGIENV